MNKPECVTFRFLSGSNLGAVFTLPFGEYTLGCTNECDVQLDEAEAQTVVALSIDASLQVKVRLVSGRALLNGEEIGSDLQPFAGGMVLAIGFSAITYLNEGQTLPSIDLRAFGFTPSAENTESKAEPNQDLAAKPLARGEDLKSQQASPEMASTQTAAPAPLQRLPRALLMAVGLGLLFLALISLIAGSALFGERAQKQAALDAAQAYLDAHGFDQIKRYFADDVIVFSGETASQEEFNRFAAMLPRLPYAVVLEIKIRDKLLTDIEKNCAVHGATVRAEYLDKEQGKIVLYGYVKDPYVEAQLIEAVRTELKLPALTADFTDLEQLQRLIERLRPHDFKLQLYPDRFKVYYEGDLTLPELALLHDLEHKITAVVKAPVPFDSIKNRDRSQIELYRFTNRDLNLATTQKKSDNAVEGKAEINSSSTTDFNPQNIVGVTMQPMRFISMADGSRYFEGSVMPDGAVLREISVHTLTFERNGELYIHELK